MTIYFDVDNFEVKEFYSYPTTVVNRIAEWDEGFHAGAHGLNEDVKELFDILLEDAELRLERDLHDNKIALKVLYKPTNTEMYIGYKDWNWSVGLALSPYMTGKKTVLPGIEEKTD